MGRALQAVFLILGLVLMAQGSLAASKKDQARTQPTDPDSQQAVLHMRGMYLEEFGETGRTLELWAESARYLRLEQQVELSRVKVLAPPREGGAGHKVELTGNWGQADLENKVVHIQGDVRIVTEDGYHFFTDRATYDYEAREIEGPEEVYMEGPEGTTQAVGLRVWIEQEVVLLRQGVQTLLRPEALQKAKEKMKP